MVGDFGEYREKNWRRRQITESPRYPCVVCRSHSGCSICDYQGHLDFHDRPRGADATRRVYYLTTLYKPDWEIALARKEELPDS